MYSGKSVGPRMKPWRTSVLTGYSCKDFPYRTTWDVAYYWGKKK